MDQQLFEQAFSQARLKVNRADRHIDEAQHWFKAYTETDFYDIVDDRDAETGEQVIRVKSAPVPAHLVLAIGDAFHCLSASLDYVMSGLMNAKTGNANRVTFPTDETRKNLRKSFMPPKAGKTAPSNRRIVESFPLVVLELFTVIKPYKGGDFGLWEIRKADNIDKHNLIIPSITFTQILGVNIVDEVRNITFNGMTIGIGAGGIGTIIRNGIINPNFKITNKGQATVGITFPDGAEVFSGEAVFPTLLKRAQSVTETINRLEWVGSRYL